MEAGEKDCEEETLQSAFKKLRVDAESVPGAASVSDVLPHRANPRPCLDTSGAKAKLSSPKDNWHGCMRKSSRGASRTQRRRRSKSPILQPPKFTYCSSSAASAGSNPGSSVKQQRLAAPDAVEPAPGVDGMSASSSVLPAQKELSSSGTTGHISPLVFGSCAGYETHVRPALSSLTLQEIPCVTAAVAGPDGRSSGDVQSSGACSPEKAVCDDVASGAGAPWRSGPTEAADFQALSRLHCSAETPHMSCSCVRSSSPDTPEENGQGAQCQCQCREHHQRWHGVEVYSFTGLRNVISECERGLPSHDDAPRTHSNSSSAAAAATSSSPLLSGSPRSCSEQARGHVDDITIEDLSGYMEYYLYIPKKMSHMAEMMYT